tara:strand:+ start:82 stop:384 length:303 start_codon:yes stop_codon:yes gene_type:complete
VNKFDSMANLLEPVQAQDSTPPAQQENTLRAEVERSLDRYFENIEDETVTNLHHMVISEVETPLIEAVMRYCDNNQSKASIMLGLNRGTLRTKLKLYGLL